ncbi:MAG: AEC family transporter [Rothia sp. (in: high G+C Gram-positive bacteria)]|nr:AEC family transporter [Rothia sp. (in: high G+C Gram-positive bacteria)]
MLGVLEGFCVIGVIIAVGYLVARLNIFDKNSAFLLNRFAFFVAMPPLMFVVLARADLSSIFSARLPVAIGSFLAVVLLYLLLVGVVMGRRSGRLIMGATGAGMINVNNIGLPVATYIFADASQVAPILLFQLVFLNPPLLAIMGLISQGSFTLGSLVRQPLANPLVWGAMLGLAVNAWKIPLPQLVFEPLDIIAGAAVPLVLISFGMSLKGSKPLTLAGQRLETILAVFFKLALMPLAAYLLGRFVFGLSPNDLVAATVLAGLPTAQNLYNFASRYGQATVLSRDIVMLSTLAALPSMLLVSYLLR